MADGHRKKPVHRSSAETSDLLSRRDSNVLTKGLSKEQQRRVMAAIYDPTKIDTPVVGFENHLILLHQTGQSLPADLATGLALYLNSTCRSVFPSISVGDTRLCHLISGGCQISQLSTALRLGGHVRKPMPRISSTIDAIVGKERESLNKNSKGEKEEQKIRKPSTLTERSGLPRQQNRTSVRRADASVAAWPKSRTLPGEGCVRSSYGTLTP